MKNYSLLLLLVQVLSPFTLWGQDAKTVLQKIGETYSASNKIEYDLSYTFYEDLKSAKPYRTQKSHVKTTQGMYYLKSDQTLTMQNKKYLVLIDHDRKVMMIDKLSESKKSNQSQSFSIDSLLKQYHSLDVKTEGQFLVLTIQMRADNINNLSHAILKIKKDSYQIEQVNIYYKQIKNEETGKMIRPWMLMHYKNFKLNSPDSNEFFNEQKFFSLDKKGNVILHADYKKYSLISHL